MKCVVTGGLGYIGSQLVKSLLNEDWEICVIDNLTNSPISNIDKRAKYFIGDILDNRLLETMFSSFDPDCVFNLAAISRIPTSFQYPRLAFNVNVKGTYNLIRCCLEKECKLINMSTSAVYGYKDPEDWYSRFAETGPFNPQSPYAECKHIADGICKHFAKQNLDCVIARPFNVFGFLHDTVEIKASSVVHVFAERIARYEPLIVYGDGNTYKDYIYVGDVVKALTMFGSSDITGVYNLGSGIARSVNELVSMMSSIVGRELEVVHQAQREGEIEYLCANTDKQKQIGIVPTSNMLFETEKVIKRARECIR